MHIKRIHFPSLESTNTWAKQHMDQLQPDQLMVITAAEQTGGRGRFNRTWISPANQNVYCTFAFLFSGDRKILFNMPQILALAAIQTLETFDVKAQIKWPNDLIIRSQKLGGILSEICQQGDQLAVISGIGINLNMPKPTLDKIDQPATSVLAETGKKTDIEPFVDSLVTTAQKHLELFLKEGFTPFFEAFKQALAHKPQDILQFSDQNKVWKGSFEKINSDGSLSLQLEDGKIQTFFAGEIKTEAEKS